MICRVFKKKNDLFKVSNVGSSSLFAVDDHPSPRAIVNYQQAPTPGHLHADEGDQHGDMQTFHEHCLHRYHPLSAPNYTNSGQIHVQCHGDHGPMPPFYDFPAVTGESSPANMVKQLLATMGCAESDPAQQMVDHGSEEAGLSDWALSVTTGQVDDPSKAARFGDAYMPVHQINRLSIRGEMDLWGYGK